jgi:hypothetical protein
MRCRNRLSLSRNETRASGTTHWANPSEIKPDRPWASRLTFVEDFTLEHCLPGCTSLRSGFQAALEPRPHRSYGWPGKTPERHRYGLHNLYGPETSV